VIAPAARRLRSRCWCPGRRTRVYPPSSAIRAASGLPRPQQAGHYPKEHVVDHRGDHHRGRHTQPDRRKGRIPDGRHRPCIQQARLGFTYPHQRIHRLRRCAQRTLNRPEIVSVNELGCAKALRRRRGQRQGRRCRWHVGIGNFRGLAPVAQGNGGEGTLGCQSPLHQDLRSVFWKHPVGSVIHQSPALSLVVADSLPHGLVLVCNVKWEVSKSSHGLRIES